MGSSGPGRRALFGEGGAGLVQYAVLLALLTLAAVGGLRGLGDSTARAWEAVATTLAHGAPPSVATEVGQVAAPPTVRLAPTAADQRIIVPAGHRDCRRPGGLLPLPGTIYCD